MSTNSERFAFGKNWEDYIAKHFSEERVEISRKHLLAFLQLPDLKGKYFLDIGCGSGLHSLAALRAGAEKIFSFDYDPDSVATTKKLREFVGNPSHWEVRQGSILDEEFLNTIEPADIVYSWGVLHHTGSMWQAMENAAGLGRRNSLYYIALYDHDIQVNPTPEFWLDVKRRYNKSSALGKRILEVWYIWRFMLGSRIKNLSTLFREYKHTRGMALYNDVKDWLGGWPMEFAKRADVKNWSDRHGLEMLTMKTGEANTEYLFRRS
jgi:2-polyprenyl-6-hydroxyphenyl methylase/3-demethylubiquinone-9 3-methyltransferase